MQKKKPVNESCFPDDVIQTLAEVLYPLIVRYYENDPSFSQVSNDLEEKQDSVDREIA
ncbi:MAG: hypothetical protein IJ091_08635 [Oscillospiraceae bacterium]|nr:hypothetical protein [Oscillospiraceae bacterium]